MNHFWYCVKESETYAEFTVSIMLLSAIPKIVCVSNEHETMFLFFIIPDLRKQLVAKILLKSNN